VRRAHQPYRRCGGLERPRGEDLARAIKAGAAGARVGIGFVAATESGAHPRDVAAIVEAGEGSTVLKEIFSAEWPHAYHRGLRSCVEAAANHAGDIVGERELGGEKMAVRKYSIALPTKSTTGDIDAMAPYSGESTFAVRKVQDASEIVREMTTDAGFILSETR